jgi:4-hydroxy-3-methylbut-2-enyl diphosphate reductase
LSRRGIQTKLSVVKVLLSRPRGFCAGVERAIEVVIKALEKFGAPVYVRHEIVHNRVVVEDLQAMGAVFVKSLDDVPTGSHVIFSAHGVAPQVMVEADRLQLQAIDATCPLVTKVHVEARNFAAAGMTILLIGHEDHVEVVGVRGEAPDNTIVVFGEDAAEAVEVPDPEKVAVLTQTTLSLDEAKRTLTVLRRRFPNLQTPRKEDICYATTNRQMAVKSLNGKVGLWLVIGDKTSSNSNRLRELGASSGVPAYLVIDASQIEVEWLDGVEFVGVTSGASTPEVSVRSVVQRLRELGATHVEEVDGVSESVEFQLPAEVC